jgi:hypothetical protein
MNTTAGALLRFWWLVVAGVAAGAFVALVVYSLESSAKHTATTKLFVNSPAAPFLRTQQTQTKTQSGKVVHSRAVQPSTSTSQPPDTQTLVNAANTYPLLIESDEIARVREQLVGTVPGTVKANALNASTNTYGVFRPSPLPVIEVKATSKNQGDAQKLADGTVQAFASWMLAQQKSHRIPAGQRISVQQLQRAVITTTGGPSPGLPLFIGALVLLAFCGLAVVADGARPAEARTARETPHGAPASPHLDG